MGVTAFPSEQKLERLRTRGQLPLSRLAPACVFTICVALGIWTQKGKLLNLSRAAFAGDAELSMERAAGLLGALVAPLLIGIVLSALVSLLQTKFHLRLGFLAIDLGRLTPQGRRLVGGGLPRLLVAPIVPLLVCFGMLLVLRHELPGILSVFNSDKERFLSVLAGHLGRWMTVSVIVLVVSGVGAIALEKLWFLWKHRMTREELAQELREKD